MAAKTHARRADATIACGKAKKSGNGEIGIFVVGGEFLFAVGISRRGSNKLQRMERGQVMGDAHFLDLPAVTGIRARSVVC